MTFRLETPAEAIEPLTEGFRVALSGGERLDAERVLLATGRHSRIAGLDPAAAGIALDERGRPVLDPLGRTSDPRVWVAGDARGGAMHTPLANAEGRHVALALLGRGRGAARHLGRARRRCSRSRSSRMWV